MSIIDTVLSVLAPYECLGCRTEGALLCQACGNRLPSASDRSLDGLRQVRAVAAYDDLAKSLVWQLKSHGARAAALLMAGLMADAVPDGGQPLIVPVPTATSRVRRRGYDQAKLLARALSGRKRLTYSDCLRRSGQTHQVGASRQERLEQLQRVFRVRKPDAVRGRHILLVDDVMTTGATLQAAARVLRSAGAGPIEAVTFCSV